MSDIPTQQEVDEELHECARFGELDVLQEMVATDDTNMLNWNALDETGNCALHKAAANNHVEMLQYLKKMGCKYIMNQNNIGPITWAILNKHLEATVFFLDEYAEDIDVLLKPEFGLSPLSTAYDVEAPQIVEALLKHKSSAALESGEYGAEVDLDDGDDAFDENTPDKDEEAEAKKEEAEAEATTTITTTTDTAPTEQQ